MNSAKKLDKKFKYRLLKNITIRTPLIEDADKIINLIKKEYGKDYPERHYYHNATIEKIINNANKGKKTIWKCAFLKNNLIGQTLFEIINEVGFIKLTIVREEFRHIKILSLLGFYLAEEIKKFNETYLKYIYAIVDKNNIHVINLISKYKFIKLATTPMWEKNRKFIIFGRKSFNFKDQWRQIDLDFNLFKDVFYLIKKLNLKVHIQAHSPVYQEIENKKTISLKLNKIKNRFYTKYSIILLKNNNREEICAEFTENTFLKSWYDFRFMNDYPYIIKVHILSFIIESFNNSRDINSISLIIDTKDYKIQNFLLNININYFGFLPYYLGGNDAILMGKSKIPEVLKCG
ncbi:MAG: hypothetical protein ACFFEY_11665 [Candidatus Thorarchaeota archaeon]